LIGETIEQYRILEIVGRGGMGIVYKALDVNLDRTVAVKVINAEMRDDPMFVERFRHEARIQAALNHPNIAMLFDFLVWNNSPVAVMELIEGETLQHRLQRSGPIPAHVAIPIAVQALRGVAAGHRRGIIHRDLKPANLMVTDEGVVKVTDFGIAKIQNSTGLTQMSTRVGSSPYMSPEQILGRPVDARTDIYAMGVTLYELLCGRPPFQAKTSFEIESAHVSDMPLPPIAYNSQIPPAAVDAVMRALAKNPDDRFTNADEFIRALPDLHGVPYVDTDATSCPPTRAAPSRADAGSAALTLLRSTGSAAGPAAATAARTAAPRAARSTGFRAPRAAIIAGGIVLVALAVVASLWWMNRTAPVAVTSDTKEKVVLPETTTAKTLPDTPPTEPVEAHAPPEPQPAPVQPPKSRPRVTSTNLDLSGAWTGVYADTTGNTQLRVSLQIQQITNGSISGSLTYKTDAEEDATCTLEKSSYSKERKRLRLIVHCHNPSHPRYLNVPLDFVNVDPRTDSLKGGRLEFHLADDIVVSLTRMRSV
jgi:serine/threonine-protein kinase